MKNRDDIGNVDVRDERGQTFLHKMINSCNEYGPAIEELEESIESLNSLGADLNAKDNEGNTVMHLLARNKDIGYDNPNRVKEIFSLLISKGADLTIKNKDDHTVLETALLLRNYNSMPILKAIEEVKNKQESATAPPKYDDITHSPFPATNLEVTEVVNRRNKLSCCSIQ